MARAAANENAVFIGLALTASYILQIYETFLEYGGLPRVFRYGMRAGTGVAAPGYAGFSSFGLQHIADKILS